MSVTAIAVTLALIASLVPLLLIAQRDPKRLRSIPPAGMQPMGVRPRQALTALTLLPGAVLIASSQWPALLIWLGGLIASGWILVQLLAARR